MLAQLSPAAELARLTAEQAGTKAAALARLMAAGFPVPLGLCVTTGAFRAALAPFAPSVRAALQAANLTDMAEAQAAAQTIQNLLADLALPESLRRDLQQALPFLGGGPLAVRSSATLEDLGQASFAGQYHTSLGVIGAAEVEAAILACWRSFFSPAALAARAAYAPSTLMPEPDPAMAVLIQGLIDAECSGVCFSVDPVHKRPEAMLIAAAWGLGAGVVEGTVPADTARVLRTTLEIEQHELAIKGTCLRLEAAGGIRRVPVAPPLQRTACLPEAWLRTIAEFGLALEQFFGLPQDVEWAIAGGQIWILQSRPITTLTPELMAAARFPIEWADDQERKAAWHAQGFGSRGPGALLLPAEISFATTSFEGGTAAVVLGGGNRTFWQKIVNGRLYWAPARSPVSPADQRIRSAALEDLYERLAQQDVTRWEHMGPEVIRATQRLAAFDPRAANGPALADHLEDTLAASRRHWMVHTLGPRKRIGSLVAAYRAITGAAPDEAEAALAQLLEGEDTVQTGLIDALYALARLGQSLPEVAALLAEQRPGLFARLKVLPSEAVFVQSFEKFLAAYGDRPGPGLGPGTLMETLPWRENPDWVLGMAAKYLARPGQPAPAEPAAARRKAREQRDRAVEAACATAAQPHLAAEFRRQLAYARREAKALDDHNHYIDQLTEGQYYQALLCAGRWLAERGDLPDAQSAAWLEVSEIVGALREPAPQPLGAIIAERQRQYAIWHRQLAPATLGVPASRLPDRPLAAADEARDPEHQEATGQNRLAGQGVSPGRCSGRARLVAPMAALPDIQPGDILVIAEAGTLWTPIFPILAGVVMDGGGVAQHAAITLREFGVPAVFGTREATRRIPAGAWVTLDGAQGIVEWIEETA